MECRIIRENKKQFMDLLLLGDEQESMIDRYLARGEMFALYDDTLKGICVVTRESADTCELKNITITEEAQGMGYGSKLLQTISAFYKDTCKTMLVGTGDFPPTLRFYEKNGFVFSHRLPNFFTENYDHPIFEGGVQLVDMVYLKKELS